MGGLKLEDTHSFLLHCLLLDIHGDEKEVVESRIEKLLLKPPLATVV